MIVGGGGREHALAWKLAQSAAVTGILACPGNPGITQIARCVPKPPNVESYADLALAHGAGLTVVGPEAPLVEGIADCFHTRGLPIIGPTQAAARLEGSKIFAKEFFSRAGIPTARSRQVFTYREAIEALRDFSLPVVVKTDGLAAGKGVVIAHTSATAEEAIRKLGPRLVIEEFLEGEEVSFICLTNGTQLIPFAPTQDHKRIFDGDAGPNTGGMGAYCDTRILSLFRTGEIMDRIMLPALSQMHAEDTPFAGFLYAGVILTADGPKLLEFNARLGDPETQCLMHGYRGDFFELLRSMAFGEAAHPAGDWPRPSVCVVMAAEGYPAEVATGAEISGIEAAEATGAVVFHAGTQLDGQTLRTSAGRVLGITAGGSTLKEAIDNAYSGVAKIQIPGAQFRTDIGQKGLARW